LNGIDVSYERQGIGEPVVLTHAAAFAPWYAPLAACMPGCATVRYVRNPARVDRGFAPLTIGEDAAVCARLMDHLGWRTAHVVGHSYGALLALRLCIDDPGRVRSLVLLEPALRDIPSADRVVAELAPAIEAYRRGDRPTAVDRFLQAVCGADYRETLERGLPEAFGHAVEHADVFFQVELRVVQDWSFDDADAASVTKPVLNVLGARSEPRFVEGAEIVQRWFPNAERFTLPAAGHLLMVENPGALADALIAFFARHSLGHEPAPETHTRHEVGTDP